MAGKAFAVLILCLTTAAHGRELLQRGGNTGSVAQPSGTDILFKWHAVGTQNYTAQASTKYLNTGAVADLFKGADTLISHHFFDSQARPTFVQLDSSGSVIGSVSGKKVANQAQDSQNDDGGFGSVDELLLQTVEASGSLATVTYIQRLNTLGGVAPPALFTLPAFGNIPNFDMSIPYQADYIFLVPSGSSSTPASGTSVTPAAG